MREYFMQSERIGFSVWTLQDMELADLLWGDKDVTHFICATGEFTKEEIENRLKLEVYNQEEYGVQYWPIFDLCTQELIGCCGLRPFKGEENAYEIGFHLRKRYWGCGYAKEAGEKVLEYAFSTLKAECVHAGHNPHNTRSQSVLKKLGFEYIGDDFYEPTGLMHPSYKMCERKRKVEFRLEQEQDYFEVENVTREAFWDVYQPGCCEHLILHKLRGAEAFVKELDYVAVENEKIVGNIAYTKMHNVDKGTMCEDVIAFGPVSVLSEYQGKGIGKLLITETAKRAKELGYKAIMITGDPNYYGKFGFISASKYNIYLPGFSKEDENVYFMALELEEGYLKNNAGVYNFDSAFEVTPEEVEVFDAKFPEKVKREPRESDLA